MKCNSCHRKAYYRLKLSFAQTTGFPRMSVSFDSDGGYCKDCKGRIERKALLKDFTEICDPSVRSEVETIFNLRGWGQVQWEETVAEFFDVEKDNPNQLALKV